MSSGMTFPPFHDPFTPPISMHQARTAEEDLWATAQATIRPEAVFLKADPPQPAVPLRLTLYDAIASALGPAKFSEPRPEPGQFTPHVSAAYVNDDGPAEPIAQAISHLDPSRSPRRSARSRCSNSTETAACTSGPAPPLPIGSSKREVLRATVDG